MLAEGTGGFAAIDASDVSSVFDRIVADNTRYYVIAYHPPSRPRDAGKFYRIEVRVSRPGVTVRSRNGYTSPGGEPLAPGVTAPAQTSRTLVEALNSPVQLSDIRMRMFAAPFRAPGQNASVLFGIEIAGRDLPLEPNGTVEIASLAVDATGKAHDSRTDRLALNLEPSTRTRVEQTGVRILHRMSLAPGPYQFRVALTNPATNLAGSIIYDLHVPDFDRLPFSMSGLLLMSATGSRIITATADEQARAMLPAPPTVMRSFPQNDELGLFAEVYDDDRAPAHKVGIVTTVRSNDGAVIFEDAQERESSELRGQGMFRYTMRIPLASLDPGAYVLSVEARSRLNESLTAERHVPFAVTPPLETGR